MSKFSAGVVKSDVVSRDSLGTASFVLPFLTALAPDERYNQEHKHRHKTLTDWGRQMLLQVRRWLPKLELVVTCDSSFASLDFLDAVSQHSNPIHAITRLRLDAALYQPAPPVKAWTDGTTETQRKTTPQSH